MQIVWGVVWIIIGILLMRYTFQITQLFGKVSWAERNLQGGLGGTYTLYRLLGLIIIFLALLYMFGGIEMIISPFAPVFGA